MLKLRAAFSPNPRIRPLVEREVQAPGIELDFRLAGAGELFEWHLQGSDCDVFEFSISHHMTVMERDDPRWDWLALPIFLSKATPGLGTYVRAGAGIETAADLGGTRFGLPDFSMTGGLWLRAMLDGSTASSRATSSGSSAGRARCATIWCSACLRRSRRESQPRGSWIREPWRA